MPSQRPTSTPRPLDKDRRDALGRFYTTYHYRLTLAVRRNVRHTDDHLINDACAFAWMQLAGHRDITLDRTGFAWLTVVATREGWRLASHVLDGRHRRLPADHPHSDAIKDVPTFDGDPLAATLNHETQRERVERFNQLKPRERRELLLHAAGYSYHEIADITGSTYTAVDRRLTEGRRRLLEP